METFIEMLRRLERPIQVRARRTWRSSLLYGGPMSYGLWHEANIQAEFSE